MSRLMIYPEKRLVDDDTIIGWARDVWENDLLQDEWSEPKDISTAIDILAYTGGAEFSTKGVDLESGNPSLNVSIDEESE